MKKLFMLAILLSSILVFTGCDLAQPGQTIVEKDIQYIERFIFLDDMSNKDTLDNGYYILVDTKTRVQYIFIKGEWGTALTPMYDNTGNIILYEGGTESDD